MSSFASIHGTDSGDLIDTRGDGGQHDVIYARDGNDSIYTGDGSDLVYAGSGKDLVYAGPNSDTVYGQAAQDTLYGEGGADHLDGGNGADELFGGSGDDSLIGGKGDDWLEGGSGNDVLTGDGISLMSGNAPGTGSFQSSNDGDDVFFFDNGFGQDVILDFDLAKDTLEIRAGINGTTIGSASDLAPYIGESSGNAVITINGDSITLVGISRNDLLANLNDVVEVV
jgi:Ca2+-binding RTX toxin-like protein